jgi:hypothetical protein
MGASDFITWMSSGRETGEKQPLEALLVMHCKW